MTDIGRLAVVDTGGAAGVNILSGGLGRAHLIFDLLGDVG
jgi:hypothetical protein